MVMTQAGLVAGLVAVLYENVVPLGVPGEWVWMRPLSPQGISDLFLAVVGVAAYAAFARLGMSRLEHTRSPRIEAAWVLGLIVAAVAVQLAVQIGAPAGYGLAKWATLGLEGSSGYARIARDQVNDPWRFWTEYPEWISRQDCAPHRHPSTGADPLGQGDPRRAGRATGSGPVARKHHARLPHDLVSHGPRPLAGDRARGPGADGPPYARRLRGDRRAVVWAGPDAAAAPSSAWAGAALWPLVPSAILFQPTADTAFPFLSTSALALAAWAAVRGGRVRAAASGALLGVGMQFSLVFLPVGLIVALVLVCAKGVPWRRRFALIAATGAGFLAVTLAVWAVSGANPFVIWWWNQKNHARFYDEFHRSYGAWVIVNLIELAVAVGLPVTAWAIAAMARPKRIVPVVGWATLAVLLLLDLSGRNLSEVARLWLPLMPPLVLSAGAGITGGSSTLAATVALLGLQTLALQAMVQVVYPI